MFSDPFYERGLGGYRYEAGIDIPRAARDRNNKGRGRCSVPAHRVNGLFTGPFEPSPPPLPAGRNRGQAAKSARWVQGAGGVQGAGPPPEHSAAVPTLAQTPVVAARFSETYII